MAAYFRRYDDIENSYRMELVERIRELGYEGDWVVEEKIHGANFSFWITSTELKVAKRSTFLNADDLQKFFRCGKVVRKYEHACPRLFSTVENWAERCELGSVVLIVVYGELFGGWYPHPDVQRVSDVVSVQKEIAYSPDLEFCGFDVHVTFSDGKRMFLTVDDRNEVLEKAGFMASISLFRGSLDECLKYPNKFPTTIPRRLGFPEIEGNECEGVVIRPVDDVRLPNGQRVLMKNKNEKFAERTTRKKSGTFYDKRVVLSPNLKNILEDLLAYHVKARFISVISKHGIIDANDDVNRIMGLYIQDLMADFAKDHGETLKQLTKKERKQLSKVLFESISADVKSWIAETGQ